MKLKRVLALLLVFVLALSIIACNDDLKSNDSDTNTDEEITTAESTPEESKSEDSTPESKSEDSTDAPKTIAKRTYDAADIYANSKILGRTSVQTVGLTCDHSSTGIEFNAYIEGKLTIDVTVAKGSADSRTDDCYFTLFIDGKRSETRFMANKNAKTTLELANFEEGGVHNIRFVRQTEARSALAAISSLTFTGYFEEKPANAQYYIEFMGASNTAGYGNLTDVYDATVAQLAVNQDSTQSYTYLTAKNLEADYSMLSVSGIGVVDGYRKYPIQNVFEANSYYRSQTVKYNPTRTPDLIVMAVGSNDEPKTGKPGVDLSDYRQGVIDLIMSARVTYGENVPIVWVYYTENMEYREAAKSAINACGGEDAYIYDIEILFDKTGGNNHPGLQSHIDGAEKLTNFIKEKEILK